MSCCIFVKGWDGKERTVCVDSEEELKNMTVGEFKRRAYPEFELNLRLIFDGKQLEDEHTLGFYGIKDRSILHALKHLCGGGPSCAEEDDGDEAMSRTRSIERLAEMQKPSQNGSCSVL
ncbi:polyubiquitin 9-like [Puntigrus tetrazona]|uniref:polyubiquitin 9-like n=1 Tax=Puntigrus tetrazona TaxID=1606681 RepID=UPI001C8AAB00|nr:polyubiquitin 9-like [Puntigrus tetrazona]